MKHPENTLPFHDATLDTAAPHTDSSPSPSPELAMIVRSFAAVLIGQAVADGEVQAVEMRHIEDILRKNFYVARADIQRLVREALTESTEIGSLAFENALCALRERFLPHQRKRVEEALFEIAKVDGYVDDRERVFFAYVSKRLGLEKPCLAH
jgi:uncharacterized tellurite resistance protein B-like protein